jgi:hypothetical protein
MTDLPLHVRVASALGWTELLHVPIEGLEQHDHWTGKPPAGSISIARIITGIDREKRLVVTAATVPRYDTDWAATGPLIERLRICLLRPFFAKRPEPEGWTWLAQPVAAEGSEVWATDAKPLMAVCLVILKMKEDGMEL